MHFKFLGLCALAGLILVEHVASFSLEGEDQELIRVKREVAGKTQTSPAPQKGDNGKKVTWVIEGEGEGQAVPLTDLKEKNELVKEGDDEASTVDDLGVTMTPAAEVETDESGGPEENIHSKFGLPEETEEATTSIGSHNENDEGQLAAGNKASGEGKPCLGVICIPATQGAECMPATGKNIPKQMEGFTANGCCPIHHCRRQDGSTFYHYGIEISDGSHRPSQQPPFPHTFTLFGGNTNSLRIPQPRPPLPMLPPFLSSLFSPQFSVMPQPSTTFYTTGFQSRQHQRLLLLVSPKISTRVKAHPVSSSHLCPLDSFDLPPQPPFNSLSHTLNKTSIAKSTPPPLPPNKPPKNRISRNRSFPTLPLSI